MSVSRISVCFRTVSVIDDATCWGPGEWTLSATVDGKPVGDPNQLFEARSRKSIELDSSAWFAKVDVEAKGSGSKVEIRFEALEKGKSLGKVAYTLKYPFKQEHDEYLPATKTSGGIFSKAHSRYSLNLVVKILQEKVTASLPHTSDLYVNRQANGTQTFSTLAGAGLTPRVEICPVVPAPSALSLPPRPKFPVGFAAGKATPQARWVELSPGSEPNALPNPSVIPIRATGSRSPDVQTPYIGHPPANPPAAFDYWPPARIAVTYIEPGNLETDRFAWSVKSGPVEFFGETEGRTEVQAYGTGSGETDQEAIIELRWGKGGPLLSSFRALVGKMKEIPFRALVLNPSHNDEQLRTSPGDVWGHIAVANVLLWQAGLQLVPDPEKDVQAPLQFAGFDGVTPEGTGVFSLKLPETLDKWSTAVDTDAANLFPDAARLNFRPGVLNIVYIKATLSDEAIAIDRTQLDGGNATDQGSPSTSWVQPSGIPPDKDAGSVSMMTCRNTERKPNSDFPKGSSTAACKLPDAFDKERKYLKKRLLPDDALNWLFSLLIPDSYEAGAADYGIAVAHFTCQAMGLKDRGFFGGQLGSEDGINDPAGRAYPLWENLMSPGVLPWSQDLDLVQTKFLRKHPLANGTVPTFEKLKVAAGFDRHTYPGEDQMRAWSLASPYSFVNYYLMAPNHKTGKWTGTRETLLKQGWKVFPTYFGQQPAGTPSCSQNTLTSDQGEDDGEDAVEKTSTEGFPDGTYIHLNVEHQDHISKQFKEYITAWVVKVATYTSNDGNSYKPAVYLSKPNADEIKKAIDEGLKDYPGVTVRYWVTGGNNFSLNSNPPDCGTAFTDTWQCPYFGLSEAHGAKFDIDQDVSSREDPAAPDPPMGP